MRWVTYLSPSGGERRPGVVDDGCVFGCPGGEDVPGLLAGGADALAAAHRRALEAPVEIIVEFETRLCAPLVPDRPVVLHRAGREPVAVPPGLVRGTDDGVVLPAGERELVAEVGAVAFRYGTGQVAGYTPACLWTAGEGEPVALTLGPALVTAEEADGAALAVSVSVDDLPAAQGVLGDGPWRAPGAGTEPVGSLPARTGPVAAGAEFFVEAGPLGSFELRVGTDTGT
ncbi:hypothetical protein AC529_14110 [Thermobifida cellulosilytica TB100]|uniref:Uncharacterized protein n=2 Tax=Thermobifida cellulosilytica TaxID=144786 RepID=A0A147KFP7_THECS|nr:hypothetical protein [Thermobifida cellulosilytica]KUP96088.1 hypothetical protein AC529_14110 [Thermobifida cellulosilytica TB100]